LILLFLHLKLLLPLSYFLLKLLLLSLALKLFFHLTALAIDLHLSFQVRYLCMRPLRSRAQ
jgi:hypothetical protein